VKYSLSGKLWKYNGEAAWYFITLPKKYTDELKALRNPFSKNFGSVKVIATIGLSTWQTSIFPDSKTGSFMLPVKKEVRIKNKMTENQTFNYSIEINVESL
jgi:hypothetical protein